MSCNNPQTPTYSKAKPIANTACIDSVGWLANQSFLNTGGGVANIEMLDGYRIDAVDLSDSVTARFRHDYTLLVQMVATLNLTAQVASVPESNANKVLGGIIIDEVNLTWSYNRETDVVTQSLTNTALLTPPTLGASERSHDYTGEAILAASDLSNPGSILTPTTFTFTLTGNDGKGNVPESYDSDTATIQFANYMVTHFAANQNLQLTSGLQAIYDAGTQTKKTSRAHSFFPLGGVAEHIMVFFPANWDTEFDVLFTKGELGPGGFERLKNVAGTLKTTLGGGDSESSIILSNGTGTESYRVYQSFFDNQADTLTPFTIS